MNSYLIPFFDDEEFVTGLLVDVTEPDTVVITSCGHPPAVLVPRDGTPRYVEARTGLPLGLDVGLGEYTTVVLPWVPGDRLLMYTDGLTEARNDSGRVLPPARPRTCPGHRHRRGGTRPAPGRAA